MLVDLFLKRFWIISDLSDSEKAKSSHRPGLKLAQYFSYISFNILYYHTFLLAIQL